MRVFDFEERKPTLAADDLGRCVEVGLETVEQLDEFLLDHHRRHRIEAGRQSAPLLHDRTCAFAADDDRKVRSWGVLNRLLPTQLIND